MLPALHEFSAGYWLLRRMFVEPSSTDHAQVSAHLYELFQGQAHADGPTPVLLRHDLGSSHFHVAPSNNVAVDSIELPQELRDHLQVGTSPEMAEFLVAKPQHARLLHRFSTLGSTSSE